MNFLNTSSAAFSRFLKGQSKLNKIFDVMRMNRNPENVVYVIQKSKQYGLKQYLML